MTSGSPPGDETLPPDAFLRGMVAVEPERLRWSGPRDQKEEPIMIIISREKAATCTESELHSHLRALFNTLADGRLKDHQRRSCHASIRAVREERARPGRRR